MARKPSTKPRKKKSKAEIKAAADRAELRAAGEEIPATPAAAIDPEIVPAAAIAAELAKRVEKQPRKRPVRRSRYTPALGKAICKMIAMGLTLRAVARRPRMPGASTILYWASDPNHPLAEQFARAREIGYQHMAEELVEIADDGTNDWMERETKSGHIRMVVNEECLARSRLRIETRWKILTQALPKIYGPKATVEHTGAIAVEGAPAKPHADAVTGITARFARKANNSTVPAASPAVHVNGKAKPNGHANGHAKNGSGVH